MSRFTLHHGDSREVLKGLPDASVDSVVCDPPYELGFMGKSWDNTGIAYSPVLWGQVFRVLKPGGHLLAFGGTRTFHRLACAIEDAGFELRDNALRGHTPVREDCPWLGGWMYGSGFPKSLDVSKAIDKANGRHERDLLPFGAYVKECREARGWSLRELDDAMGTNTAASWWEGRKAGVQPPSVAIYERLKTTLGMDGRYDELIQWVEAEREKIGYRTDGAGNGSVIGLGSPRAMATEFDVTAPATDAAREWAGWGTALKPAWEPIVMARKPLIGTVAANVLQHGTGALNIDGCRIDVAPDEPNVRVTPSAAEPGMFGVTGHTGTLQQGRWPANLIHDGSPEVIAAFPDAPGQQADISYIAPSPKTSGIYGPMRREGEPSQDSENEGAVGFKMKPGARRLDDGSAARFFYCAKASREDRNEGCEQFARKPLNWSSGTQNPGSFQAEGTDRTSPNFHPTVKPTDLMAYLCRLVTPKGGTVLDPFMGSGSTGKAAMLEGFNFIGIDLTAEYVEIARARIDFALRQGHQPSLLEAA